jgi:4-amino-4-deoxy-L-arabinose transferase-like glycosyltransferase
MEDTQLSGEARPPGQPGVPGGPGERRALKHDSPTLGQPQTATAWLMLLAVLVVCAVPMLVTVGHADSKRTMENIAVLSAQETWLRQHGWQDIPADPDAWLMPTRNGNPRIVKPPMVIWMDMLAWTGLTPETSTADQLIYRARVVSVAMGLLTVAGVFWIGCVLRNHKLAVLSALTAGTCLFLLKQARIASYDMHMTGWATLAVASAIWAMRPFRPAPGMGRVIFGWCLAGVALAASYMSKGPLALLVGAAPVLCTIVVVKDRWRRHTLGLVGMLLVAALLTAPWYLYLISVVRNAEGALLHEYRAERMEFQLPFYYLGLFGLITPWTVWLFGGLLQPFMRSSGEDRRQLLLPWAWFVLIFVAFSIPGAKQQRYILPIMPAAALLIGQLWCYHITLAKRGEVDPGVNLLRVPHWATLITVSVLAWPFFVTQEWMVGQGWYKTIPLGDVSMVLAASAGVVLTILALLGARWHFQWRPMRAALATALWSAVFMTLGLYARSTGPLGVHPVRASAQRIAAIIDGGVVGGLIHRKHPLAPNEEFLLYSRRIIPPVRPKQAARFGQEAERVYMIAPLARDTTRALKRAGYAQIDEFLHDYDEELGLWKYVGDNDTTSSDEAEIASPITKQPAP